MSHGLYSDEGDTYIVEVHMRYDDTVQIRRLTTAEGEPTNDFESEEVSASKLVSDRPLRDITPKTLYHFASPKIGYQLKAASFVTHGKPLVATCSHGLGSGIYGLHVKDEARLESLRNSPQQTVYKITCETPFIIQDAEHLNSLVSASMATNRYVDALLERLYQQFEGQIITYNTLINIVRGDLIDNIVNLWLIVMARSASANVLNRNLVNHIIGNYVWEYLTDTKLHDTISGAIIHELPINHIMRFLRYDGLIGDDRETNSWGRGCVSFNYSAATVLEGHGSRRCLE